MTEQTFSEWLERQFALTDEYAKEIARSADMSESYLSGLRTARRGSPSPSVAGRLAHAFAKARNLPASAAADLRKEATQAARRSSRPAPHAATEEALPATLMERLSELTRRRPRLFDEPPRSPA